MAYPKTKEQSIPAFDPNKPFTEVKQAIPAFDPNKPFTEVKKKVSDNGLQEPSAGGLDGTTLPTITQDELDKQDDVIGQIQEADALSKKTRQIGDLGTMPDLDAIAKSKEIHTKLKGMGYGQSDIEVLTKTFSDLPPEAESTTVVREGKVIDNPYSKKSFLELYKQNPIAAVTKANAVKNYFELKKVAGEGVAQEFNRLQNVNDPNKTVNQNIDNFYASKERQKEIINKNLPKEQKQKALDRIEENSDIILSDIFKDENNATNYLVGKLRQKDATLKLENPTIMEAEGKVDGDLRKFSLESIAENLDPKNKAEKLAFQKYKYGVDLDNAINSSADLNQAALTFAAEQNPQIKAQLEKLGNTRLPNAYEGEIVNSFLNSPDVIRRAEQDPEFANKYEIAKSNLYFNYPDFAKKEVATKISQGREDAGLNNWFANVPTKEGTDKLVDKLVQQGKMTEQDKLVYQTQIRDDLGVWESIKRGTGRTAFGAFVEESPIQTPGLLETTQNAFNKTIHGVARSVEDVINVGATTQGGQTFSDKERLYNKLQEDASIAQLIPKGTLHEVSMGTGNLMGFVIPMMAGGAALKGVKGGEFIANGLMFEGENKDNALKLFPDDPTKQFAYTAIATAGDMMLGHLIPKGDAAKGISKTLKGDIVDVVNKFTNKEITAAEAKKTLLNKTTGLLGDLVKENTKVAGTITGFGVFHNTLDALFGANDMGAEDIITQGVKDFKSTYLTTPMLAAMSVKGKSSGINGKVLMEVASNPELYKKVITEQSALNHELKSTEAERLSNLEDAASIKKDLDKTEMTAPQKEKYMIEALNKKILERKASGITDKALKQEVLNEAEKHDTNLILLKSKYGDKDFKDLTPEEKETIEVPKGSTVKTQPSGTEGKFTPLIVNEKGEHEVLNRSFDTPEAAKIYGEETVKRRYFDENIKNQKEELPDLSVPIEGTDKKGIPLTEVDEKVVKSRVKRIAKSLNVDEQRSQQIHDIALKAKDYEDFKKQVSELIGDDTVNENRIAEQYDEVRNEAKSEYEKELERNLEDLRAAYTDATKSDAALRKMSESPKSVRGFIKRLLTGATPESVASNRARLVEMQRQYRKEKADMRAMLPRERGANFVVEKLSRAARNGDISQEAADLAIDLIRKQPDMFGDLAISITGKKGESDGVQGWYRAADALVKVFKNPSDPTTAVHELLHHTERFLPHEIRDKIIGEWNNEVNLQIADIQKKLKTETNTDTRQQLTQGLLFLGLAQERQIEPNSANQKSMERIMSKYLGDHTDSKGNFHKGLGNSWYQLYNPSEWWAVNASRLFREAKNKPELKTWTDKAKAFYNYLIDAVKRIFKGSPTAAVEKGLKAVLNGETLEDREGTQLSASQKLLNIKQKGSFEDKLKSIYDEVNKDKISSSNTPSKEQSTKPEINNEPKANEEIKIPDTKTEGSLAETKPVETVLPAEEGKAGEKEPPNPPKEPVEETDGKDRLNDKGILNHLASAENVPEASKKGFEEKGLKYNTSSQKEAESVAKSVIDKYGLEDAVLLAEAQKFDGDVNSLIYAETLNRLAKAEAEAKAPEEKLEFAKKFAEVGIKYDEAGRKGGRFSSAINYFYKKSPLGIQMIENAKRKEAFEEWSKPKDKSWKEFFGEMMKEPEFEAQVKEQVKEGMKQERAEARAARIKKVDEFFDKAKDEFKGGAAYSTIIPPKVITAALEGMKKAYHAGEKVAEIVQNAIDYISEQLGHSEWDKDKFRKEWSEKLKDKDTKKPLTDEELKAKILDRFRNKLKGLTDKEKEEVVRKSFQKIVESGGLDYADFKKIIADITGRGELTEVETKRLKELVKETNLVDEAAEKARTERTQEARKEYFEAQTKAAKASKELNELLYNRPNIVKRLTSIMQLNTLGIPALVNNPIYNIWNQTTLRLPVGLVKTFIDQAIKYGSGGKIAPETNIVSATTQAEFFSKLGLGTKESLQQFFTGLNRADYTAKEIQGQQIRPATAIRDLWSFFKGKKNLTNEQAIDKTLQATVGIPAEIVARTLNLGDKPQRFAAGGAQAAAFAKGLGLKDIDYDLFIDFPREEAYRAYKAQGLSDVEAGKKADYIRDTIVKEGQRSTFQQDNMLNDVINRAFGGEKSGIGSLAKAVTISPYIKIPSNAYWSYYNLINPEVAFLQSMIYGAKAYAKSTEKYTRFLGDKYNTSAAKDLNEAKYWFAHGAVGMATRAVVVAMVGAGIARPSNTQDDTKKEREGEQNYEQQGTINVSKLFAAAQGKNPDDVKNGLNVQMRWFGHWGTMADAVARKEEEMTPEQREQQKNFWETAFGGMEIDALKDLNQGVFGNTSSLLTAVERKDFQNYGVNLINMFTNILQPAALAQAERAAMPYYTKQKADTFLGELNNTMLSRSKLYRDLTNQYPPSKIGIWGDKVEKKDNFGMRLFGISRANPDNFAQPIYEDYKRTNNTKFFPPAVRPIIEKNGIEIKLPTKDAARLEELVGQQRKNLISPYINDMATFEGSNKTYSQIKDDDERLDKLRILYEEGYKNGKELFLKENPQYIIPDKTKEEKRSDKKESRSNRRFRKALQSKIN